jgi:predicted secreted Zn-dependent protease
VVFRRRGSVLLALVVLLLAALGLGLWGAVGFASPKDNADDDGHHDNDQGRKLTVVTKTGGIKVVDLGAQGPSHGDMRVFSVTLYNESGKEKVGRLDAFCVVTDPADEPNERAHMAECTYTYTLPGGEISVQGVNAYPKLPEPAPRSVDAITGGTGKYVGVRGERRFETHGNKVTDTLHLID